MTEILIRTSSGERFYADLSYAKQLINTGTINEDNIVSEMDKRSLRLYLKNWIIFVELGGYKSRYTKDIDSLMSMIDSTPELTLSNISNRTNIYRDIYSNHSAIIRNYYREEVMRRKELGSQYKTIYIKGKWEILESNYSYAIIYRELTTNEKV